MESPGKRLRKLIEAPDILVMPGVFDGFSTRLVTRAGYPAAFITGSGVSESRLGQPDVGLMGLDGGAYMSSLESSVTFRDDVVGSFLKAVVFGVLTGLISTYRGYTSAPTSAGVSSATTSTVVVGSVTILLVDYVITALWGV